MYALTYYRHIPPSITTENGRPMQNEFIKYYLWCLHLAGESEKASIGGWHSHLPKHHSIERTALCQGFWLVWRTQVSLCLLPGCLWGGPRWARWRPQYGLRLELLFQVLWVLEEDVLHARHPLLWLLHCLLLGMCLLLNCLWEHLDPDTRVPCTWD